jgi:uncharacterized protein YbjT (DUF2867 family)
MMNASKNVFVTGGTGYLGKRLIALLLEDGYNVKAVVREKSLHKLPEGCTAVYCDPFSADDLVKHIEAGSVFVQLLGVSHPGPSKKELFYKIDYRSGVASIDAAVKAGCSHFVYLSVAQTPTSIMKDYQQCRAKCEEILFDSGMKAVVLRPWYIIGTGHYWPLLFTPLFRLLEQIPATAEKAKALRLVPLNKMLKQLVNAVEQQPEYKMRIVEIDEINAG